VEKSIISTTAAMARQRNQICRALAYYTIKHTPRIPIGSSNISEQAADGATVGQVAKTNIGSSFNIYVFTAVFSFGRRNDENKKFFALIQNGDEK
jgi:hypothetical protein